MRTVIPVLLMISSVYSEIISFSDTIPLGYVIDLDSGKSIYTQYMCETFNYAEYSHTEFGLFGQGLMWLFADGRTYTFFRNTLLAHCSIEELNDSLDLSDTTTFSNSTSDFWTGPCDEIIKNADPKGMYLSTQVHPVKEDFDTDQIFVIKTSEGKYCLFRVSAFITSYDFTVAETYLDSIVVQWWLQTDGTTNFKDLILQPGIEFYPAGIKCILSNQGNHSIFCSVTNNTSNRDSISIRGCNSTELLYEDSSGFGHYIDSCYFIVTGEVNTFSYELWCKSITTNEEFLIPFDKLFNIGQINCYDNFHLRLKVKKENVTYDSLSQYFEIWTNMVNKSNKDKNKGSGLSIQFPKYPFHTFSISFTLAEPSFVNIVLYSGRGQIIKTIVNEYKSDGIHTYILQSENFASGIYLMIFKNNDYTFVDKFQIYK